MSIRLVVARQVIKAEALLDTGFDGDVVLPSGVVTDDVQPDGYLEWTLADGSNVLTPYFLGSAQLGSLDVRPVLVSLLGDEPLIGIGLAGHYNVILDHGQHVIVEP